jgi:hypothetical protein
LEEADRAERMGDVATATLALRTHLERTPDDAASRLRFARLLTNTGELGAARRALAPLEALPVDDPHAREAMRRLAELDEADGALVSAVARWERLLADDIDDPQARAHLTALRPMPAAPAGDRGFTLVSPAGVETARFRLLREVGRGATATVYLARDAGLDIDVALKVLHPQLAGPGHSQALRGFFAEARVAAGLRHPRVVAIYDVDENARALAMEWIPGGTLRDRLRAHPGGLPGPELDTLADGLLSVLGFLHGRGIAHGDLKPSNLLLRGPGDVVLADFGAAQLAQERAQERTSGHPDSVVGIAGTPLYLAPEQFQGAPASPETDLYAAGAILWEAATGSALRRHADLLSHGRPGEYDPLAALPAEARAGLRARAPAWADVISALLLRAPSGRRAWLSESRRS